MGVYLLVINYMSNNLTVRDASDLRMVGGGGDAHNGIIMGRCVPPRPSNSQGVGGTQLQV